MTGERRKEVGAADEEPDAPAVPAGAPEEEEEDDDDDEEDSAVEGSVPTGVAGGVFPALLAPLVRSVWSRRPHTRRTHRRRPLNLEGRSSASELPLMEMIGVRGRVMDLPSDSPARLGARRGRPDGGHASEGGQASGIRAHGQAEDRPGSTGWTEREIRPSVVR